MHSYSAYGLTLSCDAPVAALPKQSVPFDCPDVAISLIGEPDWVRNALQLPCELPRPRAKEFCGDDSLFTLAAFGGGDFCELTYAEGARFVVDREAKRIWGSCLPPLMDEDLVTYLLGPVMGFVLRRRGVLALHASAVSLSHNAVVLCGPSGSGKSTTAAALALRGVPVLAEDISAVVEVERALHVEPGYPRVCLWPDAVGNLLGEPDALPRLTPTWEKRYLPLDGVSTQFESARQPLGAVYIFAPRVDEANAPRIEELGVRDALVELVQNTYMNWLLDREQRAAELDALAKLVENVPVRRIVPHADPTRLGDLCDVIVEDAQRLVSNQAATAAVSGR